MKRSEMLQAIKGDLARMDLDFLHGRNLDKTTYHERVEMLTGYFLLFAERYGMLPPFDDWTYHMDGDRANSENTKYLAWEPEE